MKLLTNYNKKLIGFRFIRSIACNQAKPRRQNSKRFINFERRPWKKQEVSADPILNSLALTGKKASEG